MRKWALGQMLVMVVLLVGAGLLYFQFKTNGVSVPAPNQTAQIPSASVSALPDGSAVAINPLQPLASSQAAVLGTQTNTLSLDSFIYPGGQMTTKNADQITVESSDDPTTITQWYRQKIEELGFDTKSYVQTNTNDTVSNKLIGSDDDREITVDVSKSAKETVTTVMVQLR